MGHLFNVLVSGSLKNRVFVLVLAAVLVLWSAAWALRRNSGLV